MEVEVNMFSHMTLAELERHGRTIVTQESEYTNEMLLRVEDLVADFQDYKEYEGSNPEAEALAEAKDGLLIRFNRVINGGDS